jgi:hypothetical protein
MDFAPEGESESRAESVSLALAARFGWRRSADRTRLRANSLLTGNFTGKNAISGFFGPIAWQKVAVPHQFFAQFPTQINRETISKNREFLGRNRECDRPNDQMTK